MTKEENVPKESEIYKPWEIAKELSVLSYQEDTRRYQEIVDSFKQISAVLGILITLLGTIGFQSIKELYKEFPLPTAFFGMIIYAVGSLTLVLSMIGQYHSKREYIGTASYLRKFLEKHEDEYQTEDEKNYLVIDQVGKIQDDLRELCDKKDLQLRICQVLMIVLASLLIVSVVSFTVFSL
ncbi:hypothetical protein [Lactovum odontotermitis]